MKFIVWTLVAANAAVFAYSQGWLGSFSASSRDPLRVRQQLNPEKLVLMSSASATAAVAALEEAKAPPKPAEVPQCLEVGDFSQADGKKFEAQLSALKLGERQSRHNTQVQEVSSHIVLIPPQGSKDGAEKKAAELRALGVKDYFILSDASSGPMRWAISLGVFKSESAAQALLANLQKQGVKSARMQDRTTSATRLQYRFKEIDSATSAQIEAIAKKYEDTKLRACK
nr:SPOR domain-containing protein [Massilia sp. TS11]